MTMRIRQRQCPPQRPFLFRLPRHRATTVAALNGVLFATGRPTSHYWRRSSVRSPQTRKPDRSREWSAAQGSSPVPRCFPVQKKKRTSAMPQDSPRVPPLAVGPEAAQKNNRRGRTFNFFQRIFDVERRPTDAHERRLYRVREIPSLS